MADGTKDTYEDKLNQRMATWFFGNSPDGVKDETVFDAYRDHELLKAALRSDRVEDTEEAAYSDDPEEDDVPQGFVSFISKIAKKIRQFGELLAR